MIINNIMRYAVDNRGTFLPGDTIAFRSQEPVGNETEYVLFRERVEVNRVYEGTHVSSLQVFVARAKESLARETCQKITDFFSNSYSVSTIDNAGGNPANINFIHFEGPTFAGSDANGSRVYYSIFKIKYGGS